jgi:hypothetical protein
MSRADVVRSLRLLLVRLAATHPALLFPALLLLTAMAALAVALLIVAAVAALVVAAVASFVWPAMNGLGLLLGATAPHPKAVAS